MGPDHECNCHVTPDPWCQMCHPEMWWDPDDVMHPANVERQDWGDDNERRRLAEGR